MNIVSVKDFGAVPNTAELQTKAFQKAIDFCYLNGGGEVTVHKSRKFRQADF